MYKKSIIILFFISIFFIIPVNAQVENGDFENGITGWTYQAFELQVSGLMKYEGNYGCWYRSNLDVFAYISQDVDFTYYETLQFYVSSTDSVTTMFRVTIGSNIYDYYIPDSYTLFEIDVSGINGIKTLQFKVNTLNGNHYGRLKIDSIELTDYNPLSTISFYPTQTNITPTHVNFSIIVEDESNEYGLFIYRNVSNTSNYIDYVGFHDELGAAPIQITNYGSNCTYYAKLMTVEKGIIATCEQEYIFNDSIEPFPSPEPTPNFTPVPTYTPPPTPIPPDQPNVDNGTLNMTWLNGYYNLVDNITNSLFHPIYNMTAYAMMPVNILSGSISGLMNQMELTFNIVTNEILTATSILNILFNAMPSKILNVITYYLLWIVILLIVKGDT